MRGAFLKFVGVPYGIAALFGLLIVAGSGVAGGTGYNLTYTAPSNSAILPSVDLVEVSTWYASGTNLTANLTVAGIPVIDSSSYSYFWLFGGGATRNSTAWAFVQNKTAYLHSTGQLPEQIAYTISGSTLSISLATSLVGPPSGFSFNGEASKGSFPDRSTYSFLGTNYQGGGPCSGSNCGGTGPGAAPGGSSAPFPIGAIIWPVVIAVIVIVVVILVRRRRPPTSLGSTAPSTTSAAGVGGSPPPSPPPGG